MKRIRTTLRRSKRRRKEYRLPQSRSNYRRTRRWQRDIKWKICRLFNNLKASCFQDNNKNRKLNPIILKNDKNSDLLTDNQAPL